VLIRPASHPKQRETRSNYVHLTSEAKGDPCYGGRISLLLNCKKNLLRESSTQDAPFARNHMPVGTHVSMGTPCE
jgi:hypothetical protein